MTEFSLSRRPVTLVIDLPADRPDLREALDRLFVTDGWANVFSATVEETGEKVIVHARPSEAA